MPNAIISTTTRTGLGAFSLYVHFPYCLAKCPYCDFNSYGVGTNGYFPEDDYMRALIAEFERAIKQISWANRGISSVFLGGGTPSLFSVVSLKNLFNCINNNVRLEDNCEITLEANPGTIHEALAIEKLEALREIGINRISVGAQSFSKKKLTFLGRIHSPEDTIKSVENIKSASFSRFNLDLIFGVKDETIEDWLSDLEEVCKLSPPHISAYALTIEQGTEFFKRQNIGQKLCASDEIQAKMLDLTKTFLADRGYNQYEISNYARFGEECRHNLHYWSTGDYLGIGAGAHSYLSAFPSGNSYSRKASRWSNIKNPVLYCRNALAGSPVRHFEEELTTAQEYTEFFFLRLRTTAGFKTKEFIERFGVELNTVHGQTLKSLHLDGLLEVRNEHIRLTEKGRLFSDSVFAALTTTSRPLS